MLWDRIQVTRALTPCTHHTPEQKGPMMWAGLEKRGIHNTENYVHNSSMEKRRL
jgi:hypothetical protein